MSNMLQKFSFWTFLFQKNKLRLYIYICVTGYMWKLEKYIEKEALLKIIFKLAVMIKKVYPVPRNALSCYQLARIWKERRKVILFERIHFGDLCSFFKICKNVHRRFGSNRNRLDQAGTKALKLSGFFNSLICFPFSFLVHLNIHLAIFSSFGLFTDFLLMGFSVLFLSSCRRRPFLHFFSPVYISFQFSWGPFHFIESSLLYLFDPITRIIPTKTCRVRIWKKSMFDLLWRKSLLVMHFQNLLFPIIPTVMRLPMFCLHWNSVRVFWDLIARWLSVLMTTRRRRRRVWLQLQMIQMGITLRYLKKQNWNWKSHLRLSMMKKYFIHYPGETWTPVHSTDQITVMFLL